MNCFRGAQFPRECSPSLFSVFQVAPVAAFVTCLGCFSLKNCGPLILLLHGTLTLPIVHFTLPLHENPIRVEVTVEENPS